MHIDELAQQLGLVSLNDFDPTEGGPELPVDPELMGQALAAHSAEFTKALIKAQQGQLSHAERQQFIREYSAKVRATYLALQQQARIS